MTDHPTPAAILALAPWRPMNTAPTEPGAVALLRGENDLLWLCSRSATPMLSGIPCWRPHDDPDDGQPECIFTGWLPWPPESAAAYDPAGDTLYVSEGVPQPAAMAVERPDGSIERYDADGRLIGTTYPGVLERWRSAATVPHEGRVGDGEKAADVVAVPHEGRCT